MIYEGVEAGSGTHRLGGAASADGGHTEGGRGSAVEPARA